MKLNKKFYNRNELNERNTEITSPRSVSCFSCNALLAGNGSKITRVYKINPVNGYAEFCNSCISQRAKKSTTHG